MKSTVALALLAAGGAFPAAFAAENTDRSKAEPACSDEAVIFCENWEDGDWVGWRDYNAGDSLNNGGYRGGISCADGSCLLPYPGYNNSKAVALVLPKDKADAIYPKGPFNTPVDPNDTIYARWRVYFSPGFHFNTTNTKHFYLITDAKSYGGGTNRVGFFVRPPNKSKVTEGRPYFHVYRSQVDVEPGTWQASKATDIRYEPNQPGGEELRIVGGRWYEFEIRVTPNPIGQPTGARLQAWVDGKLIMDHYDHVSVRKANDHRPYDGIWLSSYFGGGGQSTHPEQYVLYDDIIVSKNKRVTTLYQKVAPPRPPMLLPLE
ncbi:MAG: hypothetical protein GX093_02750 [Xanthomonadaceae bacterium]|nr:hypothetical protein [Xanthomonadaceae bacterium]